MFYVQSSIELLYAINRYYYLDILRISRYITYDTDFTHLVTM